MPEAAAKALAATNRVTLFSLVPEGDGGYKGNDNFHGWQVLGKVALVGSQAEQAAQEFQQAVDRVEVLSLPMCFEPRHGLQVAAGGHTFDFVLCYACGQLVVYEDNKEIAELAARDQHQNILNRITGYPENILNKILEAANIPLPRQP